VSKDLYVGNLEWNTTENELNELFAQHGKVGSVKIIRDHETGRSKGFAFISMENAEEAVTNINGMELRGRSLKVNQAREKKSRPYA